MSFPSQLRAEPCVASVVDRQLSGRQLHGQNVKIRAHTGHPVALVRRSGLSNPILFLARLSSQRSDRIPEMNLPRGRSLDGTWPVSHIYPTFISAPMIRRS